MSEHGPTGTDSPHTAAPTGQEPEHIDMGKSVAMLIGSLLAFAAVVVWAALLLQGTEAELLPKGWPAAPPGVSRAEVGIVNQKMFELDGRAERRSARDHEELTSYGWVDAKKGIVHIPIEEAMDALLTEQPK